MKKRLVSSVPRHRNVVLVTGASTGIGYELCKLFAHDRYDLVIVARDGKRLSQVASELCQEYGIGVYSIPCDLSVSSAAVTLYKKLKQKELTVDILVNNAGFGLSGSFSKTSLKDELAMIQVNITSLTHLTKLVLPGMIARKSGKILNVASTAAFQPGPLMAVYYATKAYVLLFSEALAREIQGTGITVSVLCPGPTRTQFQQRARIGQSRIIDTKLIMDATTVATAGYRGLMKGKTIIIPGLSNKISSQAHRLLPRKLVSKIVYTIQKERNILE
ncbi:MAG: SDR family oxidoreductase [Bacteroidota bacterium]